MTTDTKCYLQKGWKSNSCSFRLAQRSAEKHLLKLAEKSKLSKIQFMIEKQCCMMYHVLLGNTEPQFMI